MLEWPDSVQAPLPWPSPISLPSKSQLPHSFRPALLSSFFFFFHLNITPGAYHSLLDKKKSKDLENIVIVLKNCLILPTLDRHKALSGMFDSTRSAIVFLLNSQGSLGILSCLELPYNVMQQALIIQQHNL